MTGIGVLKSLLPRKRSCAQQEGVVSEVSGRELQLEIYAGLCKKDNRPWVNLLFEASEILSVYPSDENQLRHIWC